MVHANTSSWMTGDGKCWETGMDAAICLHWTAKQSWQPEKHIEPRSVRGALKHTLGGREAFFLPANLTQAGLWCVSSTEAFIHWTHNKSDLCNHMAVFRASCPSAGQTLDERLQQAEWKTRINGQKQLSSKLHETFSFTLALHHSSENAKVTLNLGLLRNHYRLR